VEKSVEVLAIILLGVLGLSHLVQPKAWVSYFIRLRGLGATGAFVDGFVNLALAGIIIAFHNVWSGAAMVVTLLGWALLIKSLIRFCAPKFALRVMGRVSMERRWEVQAAGAGLIGLAGVFVYIVCAA